MKKKGSRGRQRDCKGLDVDRGWNLEGTSDDAEKSQRPSRGHRRTTFCWLRWWSSWLVMQIGQSRASISNTLKRSYANLGRNPQVVAPLTLVSFFFLLYFYIHFSLFRSFFFYFYRIFYPSFSNVHMFFEKMNWRTMNVGYVQEIERAKYCTKKNDKET